VVEDDGAGLLVWAYKSVKAYLEQRKEATFIAIMQEKARRRRLPLAA
jgi:hypothetical protein